MGRPTINPGDRVLDTTTGHLAHVVRRDPPEAARALVQRETIEIVGGVVVHLGTPGGDPVEVDVVDLLSGKPFA